MKSIKRVRVLLVVANDEGITVLDIAIRAGYGINKLASAARACLDLYRAGYLKRKETPRISYRGQILHGGHKYRYYLTKKGKKRANWFRDQGYSY